MARSKQVAPENEQWVVARHYRATLRTQSIEVHTDKGVFVADVGEYPDKHNESRARLICGAPKLRRALELAVADAPFGASWVRFAREAIADTKRGRITLR